MQQAELLTLLAARILAVQRPHPVRVAIDGVDAAGKTTLADALAVVLRSTQGVSSPGAGAAPGEAPRQILRASIDRFHNPREVRYRQGPDSPSGYYEDSFDLNALKQRLLDPLGPGGSLGNSRTIQTGLFDFRTNAPIQSDIAQAAPDAILLLDGVFLLRPELAGCWDFTIFIQVSFETVLARVVERDRELIGSAQAVIERYNKRYIPAQRFYLETCRPAERADIVVINDDLKGPLVREND